MSAYIRFQTGLRCRQDGCRLGIFCAGREYENTVVLPDFIKDQLTESFHWFNKNLTVPTLDSSHWRALFWFRSDADKLMKRVWPIVALLNDVGVFVDKTMTHEPGQIVYQDHFQIAAIPKRGRRR